jgi:hypothetical protein
MFESSKEFVLSAIILLVGGTICLIVGKRLSVHPLLTATLFVWHTILGTLYSWFVITYIGDALGYYWRAQYGYVEPSLGTEFVTWITSFPVSFGFTFMATSYLYNVAGALGLIIFAAALQDTGVRPFRSGFGSVLFASFLFIPSLSFWTSGIGKDAIAFLSVALFLWSTVRINERKTTAAVAVLIMLPVRPHIAGLMLIAILAGILMAPNIRATARLIMTIAAAAAVSFAVPLALIYAGTGGFGSIAEYVSDRQTKNMGGGSSLDITGMNPAMRLFTFLYRPLPSEAAAPEQFAASIENVLLMLVTAFGIIVIYRAGIVRVLRRYGTAATYGVLCILLLSQIIANLGLATRQKWMGLPALLFLVLGAWQIPSEKKARGSRPPFDHFADVAGV